jgi:Outer membrane protein beta-barrel domain
MKNKWLFLVVLTFLFSIPAAAQQDYVPRVEVAVDYSYLRFTPAITQLHSRSFNGGGGSVNFNLNSWFGIKAEFMGYGSTTWTTTFPIPVVNPLGIIPAGTYSSQGNMFTYQFGPQLTYRTNKVNVFGELLFGGSNSNGYANLSRAIISGGGTISAAPTQHPFTMVFGGGLDINVSKTVAIRAGEIDYVLTRYSNPLTSVNNQNNFRYLAGVTFPFGGH